LRAAAHEDFGGKNSVERAGAETGAVEGHVFKAGFAEFCGDGVHHLHIHGARHLRARYLDSRDFAVMADAELPEAELPHAFFAALNLLENLARHGATIFDTRRKARSGGAIPQRVTGVFGERADLLLGKA